MDLQSIFFSVAEFLNNLLGTILFFLPDSPMKLLDYAPIKPYLGLLNYIFPVAEILAFLELWITCIGLYYVYQILLRWIKAID